MTERIEDEPEVTEDERESKFWAAHPEVLDDIAATRADPDRKGHGWPQ